MGIGPYITMITLNVNRLNAPTKRHRLDEWIQNKTRTIYLLSTKDHLRPRGTLRLKVQEWTNIYSMQMEIKRSLE